MKKQNLTLFDVIDLIQRQNSKVNEDTHFKIYFQDIELIIFTLQKLSESLNDMMLRYEEHLSEEWQFDNAKECINILKKIINTKGETNES